MWEDATPEQEAALNLIPPHIQAQMICFERDLETQSHAGLVAIARFAFRDLMLERCKHKCQQRLVLRLERQLKELERAIVRPGAIRRRIAIYVRRNVVSNRGGAG